MIVVPDIALARFWAKVRRPEDEGACWDWTGAILRNGYGYFQLSGMKLAHRVSWLIEHGEWPEKLVLHRCDNRKCVRPDHLFLGTPKDNTHDMIRKGRGLVSGVKPPRRKLTEEAVREIRRRAANGESGGKLGREFGVSHGVACQIIRRASWRHLA